MEHFDVIIIGAGPAGLNCAKHLASSDLKVLLLEKNSLIGPKICAGGLTAKDIAYLDIPDRIIECKHTEMTVHTPHSCTVIKQDAPIIYTIDRTGLGQWQLKNLNRTNIHVRTSAKVTAIAKDYITVNDIEKIGYKYIVGADGSASALRKHIGLPAEKILLGLQYIIPAKEHKKLEIFFDAKQFGPWYAWIFPHKSYISAGCGASPEIISTKMLQSKFAKWLANRGIDLSNARCEAHLINCDYRGYKFGNVYLAGDAAGLVSPFTGEGIYSALVSGEEIAKSIMGKNYTSEKMHELEKFKQWHSQILNCLIKTKRILWLEHEIIALCLKSKYMSKKMIRIIT